MLIYVLSKDKYSARYYIFLVNKGKVHEYLQTGYITI